MRKNVGKDQTVEVGRPRIAQSLAAKDKHSKICTSKGSRDRRIRLSANTAIQFYDVQDRLGFDRPSNAIDWLMKEAKAAIDVLNADQYHHFQELFVPDTATSVFNLYEAFHRTPCDPNQQNLTQDQIFEFNKSQFDFPNYNESGGFEFGNMELRDSSFNPPVVDNLKNESYGLLGICFEGIQEKEDGRSCDRGYLF
ncbi:hypothetical protein L1987_86379 [Smallanthus sonchifolius]|uniref:Uncharacterized protein n=1 Tax=Smallanthus sonchifolius TaxID=185202 RepID=A0ACB8XZT1_9ASTR|nr:hypothetical protein L1987_86379 [Smallanthus sonchifolius]